MAAISSSSAYLVASAVRSRAQEELLSELALSLAGVERASSLKYLVLNAPSDAALKGILRVLPSMESPTLLRLAKEGEWAVQTVVEGRQLPSLVRRAKLAGGKDILVMPLEKVIP
jgi:ATP phosphoribosyltransferase